MKNTLRILTAALLGAAAASAADDVVMKAMRDELARSMKKLQLENLQKPYFIAYRNIEQDTCTAVASFGALVNGTCQQQIPGHPRQRNMSVEVRVGDYARDNSNFYAFNMGGGVVRFASGGGSSIPLDDNYDEIRRQLWVATDAAYKSALDIYAKKKAALEHRTRTDDAPDFSKEPAVTDAETWPAITWNRAEVEGTVKTLSALFRTAAHIENSEVRFNGNNLLTRYINSEGTEFTRRTANVQLLVVASTQAVDGMPLLDFDASFGRAMKDLPGREEMTRRVHDLQSRLEKLRPAPLVDRYNGPVLFEGEAAGELVMQAIGNSVLGVPRLVVDDARFERVFASDEGTFADKIGNRVMPEFLSLTDNPGIRELNGKALMGSYQVDEDGVKSRAFTIVDKGYMKGLLRTRALIPNTTESTASRRGPGPTPSNLVLTSEKGLSAEQLKARLIEMIKQRGKEYGIAVRRVANAQIASTVGRGNTIIITNRGAGSVDLEPIIEAYKVFPDGHEELVRNLTVNGMTLANFKDIVAASDAPYVHTAPFRTKRISPANNLAIMMAGPMLVSVATPSLLFEDLSLQRPTGEIPNLPATKHPSFEK
jgi:hypothetical protein